MTPGYLINHHSATKDGQTFNWSAITTYHKSYAYQGRIITAAEALELMDAGRNVKIPWRDNGYHFGIERVDGRVYVMAGRMLDEAGAHCFDWGMNGASLGICWVGNYDAQEVPIDMWESGLRLNMTLCKVFKIPLSNVLGHREVPGVSKTCPGRLFNMNRLRAQLKQMDKKGELQ